MSAEEVNSSDGRVCAFPWLNGLDLMLKTVTMESALSTVQDKVLQHT